jgi:hypothetical protein
LRFYKTGLVEIVIPGIVEVLNGKCLSECRSLGSAAFILWSRISRIEEQGFSGFVEIVLSQSIEMLSESSV